MFIAQSPKNVFALLWSAMSISIVELEHVFLFEIDLELP
jgi:hypothetical protein